jgi:hypothetical protein
VVNQSLDGVSLHDCVVRAVARRGSDIVLSIDLLEPAGGDSVVRARRTGDTSGPGFSH